MRALFVSSPGIGHLFPMVPLAWALRAAGHDVLVATTGAAVEPAARAGLAVVDVTPDFDREGIFAHMRKVEPDQVREMLGRRIDDLRDLVPRFARLAALMSDGVVALADRWRPDVVVQSQIQGAGVIVASRLGVPLVEHGFGFGRTDGVAAMFQEHMADAFERHGVTELPARIESIDVAPPSMVERSTGWPMRYVPYNGGAELPEWLARRGERPRVAITLGTVAPRTVGVDPVRSLVGFADRIDAEFVLAMEESDAAAIGRLPANVRAAGWVPLDDLLPTCRAIVHHGGAGTTLTALAHGVPQVVLPTGADRHINAEAVARRGAGLDVEPDSLDAAVLDTVLHDEGLRRGAADVRAEIESLPSPSEIASRLGGLVPVGLR